MTAFATVTDIEARWRALTADEQTRATELLDDASDLIRAEYPDVDDRLTAGTITARSLTRIAVAMVRRSMTAPEDGVTQETVGPFGRTYADAYGDMYLTAKERKTLGGGSTGTIRAGTIRARSGYPCP